MQFTTIASILSLAAAAVAQQTVVSDGVTYVDVTTTPEFTVSAVSTEVSTSTPLTTTTLQQYTGEPKANKTETSTTPEVNVYTGAALRAEVVGSSLVGVAALVAALL